MSEIKTILLVPEMRAFHQVLCDELNELKTTRRGVGGAVARAEREGLSLRWSAQADQAAESLTDTARVAREGSDNA